ncbi:MBL fold metallo-hydrolase [Candidatus Micrarchaeota archaeon]|nr:MBL fold metallo-hydrolase [Candidatus Micrarchaeota archaeon]
MTETTTIRFLGGAEEVGRSCFLVEGTKKTLLDCGVKLAEEEEEFPLIEMAEARKIDSIILSHAHLDHSGFLPYLYREGCRAKCFTTKPTRDLIQVLLADYARLNEGSAYKEKDILKLLKSTTLMEYGKAKEGVVMHNAGHIIGSAITELQTDGHKILYTGDLNLRPTRLLEGARKGYEADTLIIESTYGSKKDKHPSLKDVSNRLVSMAKETFANGGKVLIPTFAIGRGQEILFMLENYMRSGALEETPIYLDGMVNKVLRIYRHNALYLKKEIQYRILSSDDDPFKSEHYFVPKTKDRSDVFEQERAIILATSGMLNGGPVLTYVKKLGPHKENTLILVGFQAKGTRGRELEEGAEELTIDGQIVPINLGVERANISGHSDHVDLVDFARNVKGLKNILVVHGEPEKSRELADALQKIHKKARAHVPKLGEEIELR